MAYSITTYTGDGVTTQFAVPFEVISRDHLTAYVGGVDTAFLWLSDGLIMFLSAPANGTVVALMRNSERSAPIVDFQDGSVLTESDLELANKQAIFVAQEAFDAADASAQSEAVEAWAEAAQDAATAAAASESSAATHAAAASSSATAAATSANDASIYAASAAGKVDRSAYQTVTSTFRLDIPQNFDFDLEGNTLATTFWVNQPPFIPSVSGMTWTPYFNDFTTMGLVNSTYVGFKQNIVIDPLTVGGTVIGTDTQITAGGIAIPGEVFGHRVKLVGPYPNGNDAATAFSVKVDGWTPTIETIGYDLYLTSLVSRAFRVWGDGGLNANIPYVFDVQSSVSVAGAVLQWDATGSTGDFLLQWNGGSDVFRLDRLGNMHLRGRIGIGGVPSTDTSVHVQNETGLTSIVRSESSNDASFVRPDIELLKSRGTLAAKTAVVDGDLLGYIRWRGYNSTLADYAYSADISVVAGTPSGNFVPAALRFSTSDGTAHPAERMRVTAGGLIGIGTTAPSTTLDVAGGMRAMSVLNPTTGAGLELAYNAGAGISFVQSYNRDTAAYTALEVHGNPVDLFANGALRFRTHVFGVSVFGGGVYLETGQSVLVNSLPVISNRRTGWTAATGTATRSTFDTTTVTTAQLAERVKALLDDLIAHGMIGA